MRSYVPNPVHKRQWTEAAPPLPRSDKGPCPTDITAVDLRAFRDRGELVEAEYKRLLRGLS